MNITLITPIPEGLLCASPEDQRLIIAADIAEANDLKALAAVWYKYWERIEHDPALLPAYHEKRDIINKTIQP